HPSQQIIERVTDQTCCAPRKDVVKIFGDHFKELRRTGNDIIAALQAVPGTDDVAFDIDQVPPLPQIAIKVDREAAARYGINVADISDLIQIGIGGGAVSQVFVAERRYDTTVRFRETDRNSP